MSAPLAFLWWPQAPAEHGARLAAWLRDWSPFVEAQSGLLGGFVLDASGLGELFGGQAGWAHALRHAARCWGPCVVLLGHHKVALAALARGAWADGPAVKKASTSHGVHVFATPADEQAALARLPLHALGLPRSEHEAARRFGVRQLGALLALGAPRAREQLGQAAARWVHTLQRPSPPLCRAVPTQPVRAHHTLDDPSADGVRLLFLAKTLLTALLAQLAHRRLRLQALHVVAKPPKAAQGACYTRRIEAAVAHNEERLWLTLLRVALEYAPPHIEVAELALQAEGVRPPAPQQLLLWPSQPLRSVLAAQQALAKVRSAWGDAAVTRVALHQAHLPHERFGYTPWRGEALPLPRTHARAAPGAGDTMGLGRPPRVRAFCAAPPLWRGPRPAVWQGPFVCNQYWWRPTPSDRDDVYFAKPSGACVWAYYDRQQRQWRVQGWVD